MENNAIVFCSRLPYVEATIAEVQRVGNVLPGSIPHKATRDTTIGRELVFSPLEILQTVNYNLQSTQFQRTHWSTQCYGK